MDGIASIGKTIILIGIVIVVFGTIVLLLSKVMGGRGAPLPGDIVIRRDNVRIYLPIASSVAISIILTLVLWLVAALRK